jgi:hypothetical protein
MSFTTSENGRLGNQFIRNLAVSMIANKHDLSVDYCNATFFDNLGLDLYNGNLSFDSVTQLTDANYFDILNAESWCTNLDSYNGFFQTKEITNFLYKHLHSEPVKTRIMAKNGIRDRYGNNNDCFVHVRLTDVERFTPGIEYYLRALSQIQFDNLYIATDDIYHPIIREILVVYPNALRVLYNELDTIHFGSTCKHIVLSHGSFSAVIGYLAYFSDVYYPEYTQMWHGDMFSIPGWICIHNGITVL